MTHDEMIAVIAAHKEGKKVQFRETGRPNDGWGTLYDNPAWNFQKFTYRIKPEPRVIWINEYRKGLGDMWWSSAVAADEVGTSGRIALRKFMEVIE